MNDALLLIYADAVDDLERVRIATDNRLRALIEVKGIGNSPEAERMEGIAEALRALEKQAIADLERAMRAHPYGSWVATRPGIGKKQAGRFLATIGDPHSRPNCGKLLQYCGHGDPARSRLAAYEDGLPFSPKAKMRLHLMSESCIRQIGDNGRPRSPFRDLYDEAREAWANRDTSDIHKHNHALRLVGKGIVKDLWNFQVA